MMHMLRAEWRKILPVFQLAAYLALVWYGCWYRPTWQHWFKNWASPSLAQTGFYPAWVDGIESLPEQIASGLNFPAVAAAALSVVPFENRLSTGASRELAMHILAALYIPLLWYLIGRWIDKRAGMSTGPLSRGIKTLAVSGLVGLLLLGILLLWSFIEGQRYTMSSLSLLWIVSGLVVIGTRLRRTQNKARS